MDEALTKLANIEVPSFRRICGFPCSALKRRRRKTYVTSCFVNNLSLKGTFE
jgi:hypothetical protein